MSRSTEFSIAFLDSHPSAAAHVLDQLPSDDAAAFLLQAPKSMAANVLGLMQPARAAAVLAASAPKEAANLLNEMVPPGRSLLLRALPEEALEALLSAAPKRQAAAMRRYLAYDPGTVGAWMDAPGASFTAETTVEACLARLRKLGHRLGSSVCVLDENRRLLGLVEFETLLSADDRDLLGQIMQRGAATLVPQAALTSVVALKAWDTALSLPVCDRRRRLVGVLHFDSLREGLVADRGPVKDLRLNVLVMHLAQAYLVSLSGLLNIAVSEPEITRFSVEQET